ncbi:FAD-dependent oxidoreductase [Paenisporosarcina sp. TG-14]|uniref:FAD-dependent oxidoreductase n=1 Tax=Paenisporosarcina sp. TG-14 TaxID=1231057 RepID=UPI0002D3E47D|nr:NAD(P)/FAD-dependent oxidoreductase [Paenisporosarcina sp. TG-14]
MKTDVFITGGGIGGLTLALKLVSSGINVVMVEKLTGNQPIYKGELLQPKSMQIFDGLHVYNQVTSNAQIIEVLDLIELSKTLKVKDQSFMDYTVIPGKYNAAYMIHHEKLKTIIFKQAEKYPNFRYYNEATCKVIENNTAIVQQGNEKFQVEAAFFIGAEGRASVTRKAMGIKVDPIKYNHHFITVTFPRPSDLVGGQIFSSYNRFLGLFPLPDNQVRSVYLIPAGDFKKIKEKPIAHFHKLYTDLAPSIDGYVQQLTDWSKIQLMIPIMYHANSYVQGNKVIIGDAAHAVHPMAGEGMNMAIQDADILGELLVDMYKSSSLHPDNLEQFEYVRKERADYLIQLSHLSALAYSFPFQPVSWIRSKTFERMEEDPVLHFKQMLNVSGLGMWKESVRDRFIQGGMMPTRKKDLSVAKKEMKLFSAEDDYPWKWKGLL